MQPSCLTRGLTYMFKALTAAMSVVATMALDMCPVCDPGHARQTSRASCAPTPYAGHVWVWRDHWQPRQIYVLQCATVRPASKLVLLPW